MSTLMEGPLCLVSYLVVQPSVGYKTTYMRTSPKSWLTSGLQLGERPSSSTPKLCRLNPKSHQFFVEPAINKPTSQQANKPTNQQNKMPEGQSMVKQLSDLSHHTPKARAWSQQPSRKTKVPSLSAPLQYSAPG